MKNLKVSFKISYKWGIFLLFISVGIGNIGIPGACQFKQSDTAGIAIQNNEIRPEIRNQNIGGELAIINLVIN